MSERMNIFWRRYNNEPLRKGGLIGSDIWTEDAILQSKKFTNVYRCLDRVSQYLIKNVIYNGKNYSDVNTVFRILLFKHFNKIETWEYLEKEFGDIVLDIDFKDICKYLNELDDNMSLYGNAYMMTASIMRKEHYKEKFNLYSGMTKQEIYFGVFDYYFKQHNFIEESILISKSLEELVGNLYKIDMNGPFLAFQYSIDLNYSDLFDFDENDFVIAGLGAKRFIEKSFEFDKSEKGIYEEIVKWIACNYEQMREDYSKKFNKDLSFKYLPGRKPTLIDFQNNCCEAFKYLKGIFDFSNEDGGKRIKQDFKENKNKIEYFFPPKWGKIL
jgi:hypothetical protein